jgi:hypothetical protein
VSSRPTLADRLALELLAQGPLPCEQLARLVAARTADVRRELRTYPRFQHLGGGRNSRWTLTLTPWDGLGRILSDESRSDDGPTLAERLEALELRVAELELDPEEKPET